VHVAAAPVEIAPLQRQQLAASSRISSINGPYFEPDLVRFVPLHVRNFRVTCRSNLRQLPHSAPASADVDFGIKRIRIIVGSPAVRSRSSLEEVMAAYLVKRSQELDTLPECFLERLAVEDPHSACISVCDTKVKKNSIVLFQIHFTNDDIGQNVDERSMIIISDARKRFSPHIVDTWVINLEQIG
jgi:hypothetical protein